MDSLYIREHYDKHEYMIPMRDGVHLFTAVYTPKDQSQDYPFLMMRTPYSCAPYGEDAYPAGRLGPSMELVRDGYIFVRQDVRGRFMSEGTFTWAAPNSDDPNEWDESADTYDTIDWLLANIPNNNGRVGTYGGSYPGFYVTVGMMDAHPALKAAMPSAPMGNLWKGDDMVRNGAFMMPHNVNFLSGFGHARPEPTQQYPPRMFDYDTPDGYDFWLELGPLPNVNKKLFHGKNIHWEQYIGHPVYDEFWQSRDVAPHLKDVKPAVMTVGGWYDAQDIKGPFIVYNGLRDHSPNTANRLILGPWYHGSWSSSPGDRSAGIEWGSETGVYYRTQLEFPFFSYYLKDKGTLDIPPVTAFNTGANKWHSFDQWPPADLPVERLYLAADGGISDAQPTAGDAFDEYISDPKKPVPFTAEVTNRFGNDWMVEDQRFASRRPDVLVYTSEPLTEDLTIAGPIGVNLTVSTSGTDADFVVKVIDVHPNAVGDNMAGYQQLVRGEPIRAKFRNSLEHPEPMVPGEPTPLKYDLTDVFHTFKAGHRIMIHVQSTWFPMMDINPGKFVDLFNDVQESDFQRLHQKVYRDATHPSFIEFNVYRD